MRLREIGKKGTIILKNFVFLGKAWTEAFYAVRIMLTPPAIYVNTSRTKPPLVLKSDGFRLKWSFENTRPT
jgi:hypothetical protein